MIQSIVFCTFCNRETPTTYEHILQCKLETEEGTIECTLRGTQLKECCPDVLAISYEQYSNSVSSAIYNLRKLKQQGLYTLAMNNRIVEVKKF
jgi:hypothetical protein